MHSTMRVCCVWLCGTGEYLCNTKVLATFAERKTTLNLPAEPNFRNMPFSSFQINPDTFSPTPEPVSFVAHALCYSRRNNGTLCSLLQCDPCVGSNCVALAILGDECGRNSLRGLHRAKIFVYGISTQRESWHWHAQLHCDHRHYIRCGWLHAITGTTLQ